MALTHVLPSGRGSGGHFLLVDGQRSTRSLAWRGSKDPRLAALLLGVRDQQRPTGCHLLTTHNHHLPDEETEVQKGQLARKGCPPRVARQAWVSLSVQWDKNIFTLERSVEGQTDRQSYPAEVLGRSGAHQGVLIQP